MTTDRRDELDALLTLIEARLKRINAEVGEMRSDATAAYDPFVLDDLFEQATCLWATLSRIAGAEGERC